MTCLSLSAQSKPTPYIFANVHVLSLLQTNYNPMNEIVIGKSHRSCTESILKHLKNTFKDRV